MPYWDEYRVKGVDIRGKVVMVMLLGDGCTKPLGCGDGNQNFRDLLGHDFLTRRIPIDDYNDMNENRPCSDSEPSESCSPLDHGHFDRDLRRSPSAEREGGGGVREETQ